MAEKKKLGRRQLFEFVVFYVPEDDSVDIRILSEGRVVGYEEKQVRSRLIKQADVTDEELDAGRVEVRLGRVFP